LGGLLPLVDSSAVSQPNLFYDTAAWPLIYPPDVVRRMLDVVGGEKVLFGSDYPLILFPREETEPGFVRYLAQVSAAKLTVSERTALLGGNLERLLPLSP
jgi:predicted TIM-barrel fold metal-dependent hydrolase